MNNFVEPMLVLSINHIPRADYDFIYIHFSSFSREVGDIFHITKLRRLVEEDHPIINITAIKNTIKLAEELQCLWVMFDVDATEHPNLEVFEW